MVLGACKETVTDGNNATKAGVYAVRQNHDNIPTGWGVLYVSGDTDYFIIQRFVSCNSNSYRGTWERVNIAGGSAENWSDWYRAYDPSILTDSTILSPLASALGAGNHITLSANADVNSLEVGKWYFKGSGTSLTNFSFSGAYLFWTSYNISGSPASFKHQYAYSLTDSAVYHRNFWGVWTDWVRLDNFGCSTPADLASLLGAVTVATFDEKNITDLNNIRSGAYQGNASQVQNAPSGASSGVVVHTTYKEGYWNVQIWIERDNPYIFYRFATGGGYVNAPWRKIQTTDV